jgi:hypothetical protein
MNLFSCFRALGIGVVLFLISGCFNALSVRKVEANNDLTSILGLQEVISFDVAVNHGKVHVLVAGKLSEKNSRVVMRYLSSDDGGEHWTTTVDVDNQTNPIVMRGNDVQIAAAGNDLVAIWQTKGELPGMGPMVSRYSHDGGLSWHVGANPAGENNGDQAHIDVIADSKGLFHAAWLADPEENGYQSLRYARSVDGGEHWQASLKLDDSTCSCCWNTLAVSPSGVLNVLYRDMKPRDMALMQSFDQGATWQRTSTVGEFEWQFEGCPHIGGGLASAGDTLQASVWTGVEGKAGLYALHSADNGKVWSIPQALGGMASHSDIAVDNQRVAVIWDERGPEGSSIFVAQSKDGGLAWSTPVNLSSTGNMATHPRIILASQGFLAMWTEKHGKQSSQWMVKRLD